VTITENILAFIVLVSVLVFVHEAGHFVVAKLARIRVIKFSLGFGKVLVSFTWRGTQYALSLIPMGGYVKMAGGDEDSREGAPDEFLSKPPWVRMLVALAGPMMNFVMAVVVFAVLAKVGYTFNTYPNRVGGVLKTVVVEGERVPAPANLAGFEEGDVIVSVGGEPTAYWYNLQLVVGTNAGRKLSFEVLRDGRKLTLDAVPVTEAETGRGMVGLMPFQTNNVSKVAEESAAAAAGITEGDRVVAMDGRPVETFNDVWAMTVDLPAGRHDVTFETPAGPKTATVDYKGEGSEEFVIKLGVDCGRVEVRESEGWLGAIPSGFNRTLGVIVGTTRGMAMVFSGKVKATEAVGGPLTIAHYAGETARAGVVPFAEYMGLLSVMLAMINLLPVPALDGGHIIIGVFETIRRKNLSVRAREMVTKIGFTFVVALFALALTADVLRFILK
jgi:regulator of sigma E protease